MITDQTIMMLFDQDQARMAPEMPVFTTIDDARIYYAT